MIVFGKLIACTCFTAMMDFTHAFSRIWFGSPSIQFYTALSCAVDDGIIAQKNIPSIKGYTYSDDAPIVTWACNSKSKKRVKEGERGLLAYLSLPPTEYSILDPSKISRLKDDLFKCDAGELNFFGNCVRPILIVQVLVGNKSGTVEINVVDVQLEGSEAVRTASNSFTCKSSTVITCSDVDDENRRFLYCSASLCIDVRIPNETWVPLKLIQGGGTFVLQRCQELFLGQFVRYLSRDYAIWSTGDESRSPVVETE